MNEKMKEMMNGIIAKLNDEQKEKAKLCKTTDELMALAGEWGIEIPDELADIISGGEDHSFPLPPDWIKVQEVV